MESLLDNGSFALNQATILEKISSGVYRLSHKQTGRSQLWTLFAQIRKEDGSLLEGIVYCQKCRSLLRFNGRTSSNLNRHKCYTADVIKTAMKEYRSTELDDTSASISISPVTTTPLTPVAPIPPRTTSISRVSLPTELREPPSKRLTKENFGREFRKLTEHLTHSERKFEWLGEQVVSTLNGMQNEEIVDETIFEIQKLLHEAKKRCRASNVSRSPTTSTCEIPDTDKHPENIVKEEQSQFITVESSAATEFLSEFM